jgi:mono/diheme cytochrome c family protein
MKFRLGLIILLVCMIASACNFSLAEDITPPPGYISPTPMPTLGPLFPQVAPDVSKGALIYTEKCAACHGDEGMGDGEQGIQLPVPVAALGLPEVAHNASPAQWYSVVTQGNLDRFMPPFVSLSEQERWDVIAYAFSLHTAPDGVERGKALFEVNCAGCPVGFFADQENMAGITDTELERWLTEGSENVPALGGTLSEDERWMIVDYLRSLTLASSETTAVEVPATVDELRTPGAAQPLTPSVQATPEAGTPQAIPTAAPAVLPGLGTVRGSIDSRTGADLPEGLTVTLRAYEHGSDPSTGPEELFSLDGVVQPDGSFVFADLELPENRIFIAEAAYEGIQYQSDFGVVEAGAAELVLPPLVLYAVTDDTSTLALESVQMFFDYANEASIQIFSIYSVANTGDKAILIKLDQSQDIPFIKLPVGALNPGIEAAQDSAPFVPTSDGFAMPPSDTQYRIIAFASMPRDKNVDISQPVVIPIGEFTLFLPVGVKASGSDLTPQGTQTIQTQEFNVYSATDLPAGSDVKFTLSGLPKDTSQSPDLTQNQGLLIGIGALGLALILAGAWLYLRDRHRGDADSDETDEYKSPDEIMDAIVALDDLHRSGKLTDAVYQQRRLQLKDRLKDEM